MLRFLHDDADAVHDNRAMTIYLDVFFKNSRAGKDKNKY